MVNTCSRFPPASGRGGRAHPLTQKQAEPFRGGPRHPRALTPMAKIMREQERQEQQQQADATVERLNILRTT